MNREVVYTAAHADFPDTEPLGGGKAVADFLIREWREQKPFPLTVLSPRSLGLDVAAAVPSGAGGGTRRIAAGTAATTPLAEMSELQYARFCRQFEKATTEAVMRMNPRQTVVLANDISEGPDFAALKDYRIVSIWHVDVVEYFTKFYLRGLVRPERAAHFPWPRIVFGKQRDCVRHAMRIVVPSEPMREMIRRCYPECPAEKMVVLPWGNINAAHAAATKAVADASASDFVIMTLSRLSPEKGIERLLHVLPLIEGDFRVWICGAAAYMKGRRYEKKLRRLADRRVEFLGHVTGARKAALLARADLFVSPSRHESYGLTIAEAEAAGCKIISHRHYGASGMVVDCEDRAALAAALSDAVRAGRVQKPPGDGSRKSDVALRLADLLQSI